MIVALPILLGQRHRRRVAGELLEVEMDSFEPRSIVDAAQAFEYEREDLRDTPR
jgi:hypothetical protein